MTKFIQKIFSTLILTFILILPALPSLAAIEYFKYVTIDVPNDYLSSENDNIIIISSADNAEKGFSLSMDLAKGDFHKLISSFEDHYQAKAKKDGENFYTMEFNKNNIEYTLIALNHDGFFSIFVIWGLDEELLDIISTVDYK